MHLGNLGTHMSQNIGSTCFLQWLQWTCVCNSMSGKCFCMYAMACTMAMFLCMDMDYFILLKRSIDYNKMHRRGI